MGQDVLSLRLHPLQEILQKPDLLKFMHRAFINVVNEVGVDINLAADKQLLYGNTVQAQKEKSQNTPYSDFVWYIARLTDCRDFFLQFVSGLGPRKARELLRVISKNLYVEHRAALLEDQEIRGIMKEVVWYNCAAFLKITKNTETWTKDYKVGQRFDGEDGDELGQYVPYAGGPLEGTRIHPESYVYARQMCTDAMNEEDEFQCLERAIYGRHVSSSPYDMHLSSSSYDMHVSSSSCDFQCLERALTAARVFRCRLTPNGPPWAPRWRRLWNSERN